MIQRQFYRWRSGALLLRPNPIQYGHLAMEMLMGLAVARAAKAPVHLLESGGLVNGALFELQSPELRIERLSGLERLAALAWWGAVEGVERAPHLLDDSVARFRNELTRELGRHAARTDLPLHMARWLRRLKADCANPAPKRRGTVRPYLRRCDIRERIPVQLRPEAAEAALDAARAIGLPLDAPLVTVHSREAGYKRGREVHDKRAGVERPRDDTIRNAPIETYFDAIDLLVRCGYVVVRLGDSSMSPLVRPGVVDLATDSRRTAELEVLCLLRSRFMLVGESGPGVVTLLTNTPTLTVNATDPISSFPIRDDGMYILKRVIDLSTGRYVPLQQLLTAGYLAALRDSRRFAYENNTSGDIVSAVEEMLQLLEGNAPQTPAQLAFRTAATDAATRLRERLSYVRKWGADEGFLGDGRIGRAFLAGERFCA